MSEDSRDPKDRDRECSDLKKFTLQMKDIKPMDL